MRLIGSLLSAYDTTELKPVIEQRPHEVNQRVVVLSPYVSDPVNCGPVVIEMEEF